ncbi:MAG TPA: hypothetical protein V6D29_04755 [Leptolyngbyaceae cyanobacterium]
MTQLNLRALNGFTAQAEIVSADGKALTLKTILTDERGNGINTSIEFTVNGVLIGTFSSLAEAINAYNSR